MSIIGSLLLPAQISVKTLIRIKKFYFNIIFGLQKMYYHILLYFNPFTLIFR